MTAPVAFPWRQVMADGLGRLRLSPEAFWSMTPREFAAATGWASPGAPARADFEALARRFPDQKGRDHGG